VRIEHHVRLLAGRRAHADAERLAHLASDARVRRRLRAGRTGERGMTFSPLIHLKPPATEKSRGIGL
jgi:hypothetical protein